MSQKSRSTKYRGIPTRTGRIIMGIFAGCFALPGAMALGGAIFGLAQPGERLSLAIFGITFLLVGMILMAPACPGIVNFFRAIDSPLLRKLLPLAPGLAVAGIFLAVGLYPIFRATNIIPTPDSFWPAPRWVGATAGALFLLVGIFLLTRAMKMRPWLANLLNDLFPLLIVTCFALIAGGLAMNPETTRTATGFSFGPFTYAESDHGGLFGQVLITAISTFLIVITIIGWGRFIIGSLRRLRLGKKTRS